jgi:ABC-type multidrug transport system permease subunit
MNAEIKCKENTNGSQNKTSEKKSFSLFVFIWKALMFVLFGLIWHLPQAYKRKVVGAAIRSDRAFNASRGLAQTPANMGFSKIVLIPYVLYYAFFGFVIMATVHSYFDL